MGNSKNIIIVLIVILIALAGWTYYTLTVSFPKEAEAACLDKINTEVIPQIQAAAQTECAKAIQQYQEVLEGLSQIPACAAAMAQ